MSSSRRQFLKGSALGLLSAAAVPQMAEALAADPQPPPPSPTPPPRPPPPCGPARGGGPPPPPATIAEAEKLVQVEYTPAERAQAAANWRVSLAPLAERRTGPRKVALEPALAPATRWDPSHLAHAAGPARDRFVRSAGSPGPLPGQDEDIAFAPVATLSRWIEAKALSSARLTRS